MKRYLFAALLLINSPVIADTTMTNNPISNSSGSVTNLGVMNMPSKQFTNTISLQQVQCQGDTLVIQPFLTGNYSGGMPKVDSFLEPIYSTKDVKGAFDDSGNEIGDGEVDDPTLIRGYKTVKRFEKTNYAISPGISLSFNVNLDRKSVKKCREGQKYLVNLLQAKHQDARLSYELGRAKHCADLLKNGVRFKKGTKYEILCADIELVSKPNTLIDHSHSIETTSEDPSEPFSFQKGTITSPSS
tara:strand:+ start:496 stop:1227 length:732 start_codon:yes stop_codon:yes gene_type:complete